MAECCFWARLEDIVPCHSLFDPVEKGVLRCLSGQNVPGDRRLVREGGKSGLLRTECWVTPRPHVWGRKVAQKLYRPVDRRYAGKAVVRVKSDGKSVRSYAVTHRRSNPTWSKAE